MPSHRTVRQAKGRSAANPTNYSQLYKQSEQNLLQSNVLPEPADPAGPQRSSHEVDWKNEYGFVIRDLRHLMVISLALLAVIVGLGFVL
jgi:hypothetical protein